MWTGPMAQLAPFAVLAFAVAFPVSFVWHARRGHLRWVLRIAIADALLVASLLIILRATLPSTEPPSGLDPWTWMPFEDLIRAWHIGWARDVIVGQMAENVLLFVPFGMALVLRDRRVPLWRVALVSAALSMGIEIAQGLAGNGRAADITDVLMNAIGGAMGWVLGRGVLLAMARLSGSPRRPVPPEASPTSSPADASQAPGPTAAPGPTEPPGVADERGPSGRAVSPGGRGADPDGAGHLAVGGPEGDTLEPGVRPGARPQSDLGAVQ